MEVEQKVARLNEIVAEAQDDYRVPGGIDFDELRKDVLALMVDVALGVLYDYAVHRDGVMYVGCGVHTYAEAKAELLRRFGVEDPHGR